MEIGNLSQIIIYVNDMDNQVKFYRDTLGLKVNYPVKDNYSDEVWVTFATGETTLGLHAGGKGRLGDDMPKFTFSVQDTEKTRTQLEAKGVKVGEIVEAYPGSYVCPAWDPEGFVFFIQSHPH